MEQIPNQENKTVNSNDIASKVGAGVLAAAAAMSSTPAAAQYDPGTQPQFSPVDYGSYTTSSYQEIGWTTSPTNPEAYRESLLVLSEELTQAFIGKIYFAPNAKLNLEIEQGDLDNTKIITVKLGEPVQNVIFSVSVVVPDTVAGNKIALKALLTGLIQRNLNKN